MLLTLRMITFDGRFALFKQRAIISADADRINRNVDAAMKMRRSSKRTALWVSEVSFRDPRDIGFGNPRWSLAINEKTKQKNGSWWIFHSRVKNI